MKHNMGHIKDSSLAKVGTDTENSLSKQGFFQGRDAVHFFTKKSVRVVSALYLISNFFESEDPIKWKVRSLGVELTTKAGHLSFISTAGQDTLLNELRKALFEIDSLLQILHISQMISPMNYQVLSSEIKDLKGSLPDEVDPDKKESDYYIDDDFFFVKSGASGVYLKPPETHNRSSHIKDKSISKGQSIQTSTSKYYKTSGSQNNPSATQKNSRRDLVVETVRKIGNVTIKDIASVIKDCSEKTLQRELLALVEENVLRKQGERRWSRYSLLGI